MRWSLPSSSRSSSTWSWSIFLTCLSFLSLHTSPSLGQSTTQYISYTQADGETIYLEPNRRPALYTQDFGTCQGDSAITLTRWDAEYYQDNMTIAFHFEGYTSVTNDSTMLDISVFGYGENRFSLTFNPCYSSIYSLCPLNATVPISASGIIPVAPIDVAGIPPIALTIPDFEAQAILRVFSNSTQSQIACFAARMTNGHTFSHPVAVGSTVGIFVAAAFIASAATALYGQNLQETRNHYAHSLSMFVVFSTLQHVFFTGALSTNFPSVLPAFWSNFAWASGLIYSSGMQRSISEFVGTDQGNITQLGTAVSGQTAVDLGGGYVLSTLYKRASVLVPRAETNPNTFTWYGELVNPGLPLPGNFSSFAGTLAQINIPASNAFLTSLLWFLIVVAGVIGACLVLKVSLETLSAVNLLRSTRLSFFRSFWIYCMAITVARACFIAFFAMTVLPLFQFALGGGPGTLAISAIVFCLFLIGMLGLCAFALYYRLQGQSFQIDPDRLQIKSKPFGFTRASTVIATQDTRPTVASMPWYHLHFVDPLARPSAHDDDDYLVKFGWLSARFRRSKWWFFAGWTVYEFVKACFLGAAVGSPLTQIFGLLIWELLALIIIAANKPFESNRLNLLMVYLLGISKVVTTGLCAAFIPRFGVGRIITTAVGIIVIVIQGVLVVCMLVAIVIGCVSSWMSVRRYKEDFSPSRLAGQRTKYFAQIQEKATDKRIFKPKVKSTPKDEDTSEKPKEPTFAVTTVRRETKIEDEDPELQDLQFEDDEETQVSTDADHNPNGSKQPVSRTHSIRSRTSMSNLPYGARRHRTSWSTRDFVNAGYDAEMVPSGLQSRVSVDQVRPSIDSAREQNYSREVTSTPPGRRRSSSMRSSFANNASLVDVANAAQYPPNSYKPRHHKSSSLSQSGLQNRFVEEEPAEQRRSSTSTRRS